MGELGATAGTGGNKNDRTRTPPGGKPGAKDPKKLNALNAPTIIVRYLDLLDELRRLGKPFPREVKLLVRLRGNCSWGV